MWGPLDRADARTVFISVCAGRVLEHGEEEAGRARTEGIVTMLTPPMPAGGTMSRIQKLPEEIA